jgi:hypothetical protein
MPGQPMPPRAESVPRTVSAVRLVLGAQIDAAVTAVGAHRQDLVNFEVMALESHCRARYVEAPRPGSLLVDLGDNLVTAPYEVGDPLAQREGRRSSQ